MRQKIPVMIPLVLVCMALTGAAVAQRADVGLTGEQKAAVASILLQYSAATLSAADARAIRRAFREAGLQPGPGLREAIKAAGFDPRQLKQLDPPPGAGSREQAGEGGRRRNAKEPKTDAALPMPEGAWPVASVIVARPGATDIDVNVLAAQNIRGCIEYWEKGKTTVQKTMEQQFRAGEPAVMHLSDLKPDTAYGYRLSYAEGSQGPLQAGPDYGFHTQRQPGSSFVFDVQGDSHPERSHQNDPALYAHVLHAAAADRPDLYLALGDDFSVDTLTAIDAAAVEKLYYAQRQYLGLVGNSAPLFLVNGNHEQAALCNLSGSAHNVAVWAQTAREKYFSQPAPGGIYTGNSQALDHIGLLRNYFAFTWGDALFVVIDPYWHSAAPVDNVYGGGTKTRDLWQITLGEAQYRWLRQTLEQSRAKYKFVFAHHVSGTTRGGIEQADFFEWGGRDRDGTWAFDAKRPGWGLPIHQLMAKTGVTIFFQGHDHIFARQEKDGVMYQTLPVPSGKPDALDNKHAYRSGDVLAGSGRLRVTVSPDKVRVEFVRSYLPKDATPEHPDGEVAFSYSMAARPASITPYKR